MGTMRWPHALRSLRHRNVRLFAMGQSVSLMGTWMQNVAMGWLVYRLTNSAFLLGLVAFGAQGPSFILAPFAGVLADRLNRKRMIMGAQVVMMIQAKHIWLQYDIFGTYCHRLYLSLCHHILYGQT